MLDYVVRTPSGRPETDSLPLVILMHGRGADANDLADLAPLMDPPGGARIILPNAPKPFEAYPGFTFGFTWFDGWPPRGESMRESRALVLDFVDEMVKRYPTPPGKIIICGFSQGGLLATDAGYRMRQPIAGIVVMSGALCEQDLPDLDAHKDVPLLIVHGTEDDMIPLLAARRARRIFEEHGIEPEYHEFPMGHFVTPDSMAVVRDFIARCLV